ncbi:MAG: alpha/beta fold hydrolase [Faecalibacterium sp.]
MKKAFLFLCSMFCLICLSAAAAPPADAAFLLQSAPLDEGKTLQYGLYLPETFSDDLPLIVYLHGGSGKGEDFSLVFQAESLPFYLEQGLLAPQACVLIPQLPGSCKGWSDISSPLLELIGQVVQTFHLDPARVSLTGHSMGGTGAWALAQAEPGFFSAVAPLSGSPHRDADTLRSLRQLPIWAIVGAQDSIVPPESSVQLIDALGRVNRNCRVTILPDADHFSVPAVYLDPELDLLGWLTAQRTAEPSDSV